MSEELTPTQSDVWRAVCNTLENQRDIGPAELGRLTYRQRPSAHYYLAMFARMKRLRRVGIGKTGKRTRYTLP